MSHSRSRARWTPQAVAVVLALCIERAVCVVYAHPSISSFAAAVHRHIVEGLAARGHRVDDLVLYAEQFQPALTLVERDVRYEVGANLAGVDRYVERLRAAEALVLWFSTWWCGILKRWFDRARPPGVPFIIR